MSIMDIEREHPAMCEIAPMTFSARRGLTGMTSTSLTHTAVHYLGRDLPDERMLTAWRQLREAAPPARRSFHPTRQARHPWLRTLRSTS
jgi:hypothetical protein